MKFCSGSSHKNIRSSDGEPGELVDQVGIVVLVVDSVFDLNVDPLVDLLIILLLDLLMHSGIPEPSNKIIV